MPDDAPEQPVAEVLDEAELAASLAHDQWCNSMRRAGWRYGDTLDLPGLTHPHLVPYRQLPEGPARKQLDDARSGVPAEQSP